MNTANAVRGCPAFNRTGLTHCVHRKLSEYCNHGNTYHSSAQWQWLSSAISYINHRHSATGHVSPAMSDFQKQCNSRTRGMSHWINPMHNLQNLYLVIFLLPAVCEFSTKHSVEFGMMYESISSTCPDTQTHIGINVLFTLFTLCRLDNDNKYSCVHNYCYCMQCMLFINLTNFNIDHVLMFVKHTPYRIEFIYIYRKYAAMSAQYNGADDAWMHFMWKWANIYIVWCTNNNRIRTRCTKYLLCIHYSL